MIVQLSIGHISASCDTDDDQGNGWSTDVLDDVTRRLTSACVEMFTATCEAIDEVEPAEVEADGDGE